MLLSSFGSRDTERSLSFPEVTLAFLGGTCFFAKPSVLCGASVFHQKMPLLKPASDQGPGNEAKAQHEFSHCVSDSFLLSIKKYTIRILRRIISLFQECLVFQ